MVFKSHKYASFQEAEFKIISTFKHVFILSAIIFFSFVWESELELNVCVYWDATGEVDYVVQDLAVQDCCVRLTKVRECVFGSDGCWEKLPGIWLHSCLFRWFPAFGGEWGDPRSQCWLWALALSQSEHLLTFGSPGTSPVPARPQGAVMRVSNDLRGQLSFFHQCQQFICLFSLWTTLCVLRWLQEHHGTFETSECNPFLSSIFCLLVFWPLHVACRILVP